MATLGGGRHARVPAWRKPSRTIAAPFVGQRTHGPRTEVGHGRTDACRFAGGRPATFCQRGHRRVLGLGDYPLWTFEMPWGAHTWGT